MPSSTPITTTAEIWRTLEISGECMKGRIRFMTAITPAYAHAYQVTCLTRHMLAVQSQKFFRLPNAKDRYPHLSNVRTTTRERGNYFQG